MILDSLEIDYKTIDVTEPGNEKERDQMQAICKKRNSQNNALPPQFFNDDTYCGVSISLYKHTYVSFSSYQVTNFCFVFSKYQTLSQDYEDFDAANDEDNVKVLLKLEEANNIDSTND